MNEFPNPINLRSKLKPMLWHDRAGLDGVVYHSTSVDDYVVSGSHIYIRYDVNVYPEQNVCCAFIQFPDGSAIEKYVKSRTHAYKWCESRREIFWNELWRTITEEIFVEK